MKIVVLDGYTLNPGDLNWEGFRALGDLTVYDHTSPKLTAERARDAEILLTNKTVLGKRELSQLPMLQYIGVFATGYNVVDIAEAFRKNITVTNIPGYSTDSVAQMVFAHLLNICHNVQKHSDVVKQGAWTKNRDFCFWNYPLTELTGKTMGIIGFGQIGRKVAQLAAAFGMDVVVCSRSMKQEEGHQHIRWAVLNDLLQESDVVSLHCPLVPETKNLINKRTLSLMKKDAILINTARGPLINEADLAAALSEGKIAWAAVDVLSSEPPSQDNPLLSVKNCLITPHIAWATRQARYRLMNISLQNLKAYLTKAPINIVKDQ